MIAGIDLDSNGVHIVLLNLDDDQALYHRIRVNNAKGDYHARARRLRDQMPARRAWKDHGVVLFAIEEPMSRPGKGGFQSIVPQTILRGALLACLPVDIDIRFYKAAEWKKASLGGGQPGRGHAQKPEIRAWVDDRWPNQPDHMTQDAADAYAIAWAGRREYVTSHDQRRRNAA